MMQMNVRPCLDEFEKLLVRMNTPRVMIDNAGCVNATLVMVDSARKDGILLEAVQVLTDLNLLIKKGYVSSDGRWNMDVFHVTDLDGKKLTDDSIINCIQHSLGSIHHTRSKSIDGTTAIELTGTDRVGLLSEIFAVLSDLKCDITESKLWTHNGRIASLIYLKDHESGLPIYNSQKLETIEARLSHVLKGDNNNDIRSAKTTISMAVTHTERRLHQMMFADRDYERNLRIIRSDEYYPNVLVQNGLEKGYSVVKIQCRDRPKLLFDVVFTLTDLEYSVFHATIDTKDNGAYLEFFIRHTDGTPIGSEAEKQRVTLCLTAAIERRASNGVRLELRKEDKPGLLAEVTRIFREYALNVTRAEISTTMGKTEDIFYVTDACGNRVDPKSIESVRQRVGLDYLRVKELPLPFRNNDKEDSVEGGAVLLTLGSLLRKNLYYLGLIKSYY